MTIKSAVLAAAIGCTLVTTSKLSAQITEPTTAQSKASWEILVPSGTLIPTGSQRDAIKRGNISALQVSYVARPYLAITSMVGWARSRDIAVANDPKLDVFTYDAGAEARAPGFMTGKTATFSPFVGAGIGGRSYNYRKLDVDATHNMAAYGSVGGELGLSRLRVRLEARDYVAGFKPLNAAGVARTGNDVVVMAGLRLVRR